MAVNNRRIFPPFDGLSLTPVGVAALGRPPCQRKRIHEVLRDGSIVIDMVRGRETMRQTCWLTPEGVTAAQEAPSDEMELSDAILSLEDIDPLDLERGEWVGSDGSPYRVSESTVSIPGKGGAIELSTSDLVAIFQGVPRVPKFPCTLVLDVCRKGDGWRLLGGRIHDDEPSGVRLCSLLISADGKELTRENAPRKVCKGARCWRALGAGRAAVGYTSGRIEILALNEEVPRLLAVGFTVTPPEDLAVTRGPTGLRLVVIAGDVVWFDLGPLDLSPAKALSS